MREPFPLLLALHLIALTLTPVPAWPQGTTTSRTVAPGVIHHEYTLPGPYTLDVLEVVLGNPTIVFESYRPNGLTRTSTQAAANDQEGHRVVGAINADFFSFETGWPVGNQVVNGMFALGVWSPRSHVAFDERQRPFIDRLAFRGAITASGGESASITEANLTRSGGEMVLYTPFYGTRTGTDASGFECALEFIDAPVACDTIRARVTSRSNAGNMAIPPGGAVLSGGPGAPAAFLDASIQSGDTIRVIAGFDRPLSNILQVLGGAGRILMRGRYVADSMAAVEDIGSSFITARHPRTFLGFNNDTSKVYLCTVDGRQATSLGMSFLEMANFLGSIGVTDAFNFDGGGSTTMVVRGVVTNSPSDPAGERSVANSLHVISTAPTGTLTYLDLRPTRVEVFHGGSAQFTAAGTDESYNPIPLPPGIAWEADARIGTISTTGLFTPAAVNDSGWVTVRWNTVVDSSFVVVRTLTSLSVHPAVLTMVPGERVSLLLRSVDSGNNFVTIPNTQASFSSPSPAVVVDGEGLVTAMDFGTGTIDVTLGPLSAVVPFDTRGTDTTVTAGHIEHPLLWNSAPINAETTQVQASYDQSPTPPASTVLKIAYSFVPDGTVGLVLDGMLPTSGRPDSLAVPVFGSGNGDTVRILLTDRDGQVFAIAGTVPATWSGSWKDVGFRLNRATPVAGGVLDYPVAITQIRIMFGNANQSGGTVQGTIYIGDMLAHYPLRSVAPEVLYDFEAGVAGWLTPAQSNAAQLVGINIGASSLVASTDHAWQGSRSGKWTFADDAANGADWSVRIPRSPSAELGSILRGSYLGAWVYAEGQTDLSLHIVVRDGNGLICEGPAFPVNHHGWKLIGARLDPASFKPYLTSGSITDANNRFNGFHVEAPNARVGGQTRILYIDKLVTSALTVPTGFISFSAGWASPLVRLTWSVNSEISINRYVVERAAGGDFLEIGSLQGQGNTDTTVSYEFVDTPAPGITYQYRIRQVTNDGAQELSQALTVSTGPSSVGEVMPVTFELHQNFPNPFNPTTVIRYQVSGVSDVKLVVYDLLGREVAVLVDERQAPGHHTAEFNASRLASGMYVYRLTAGAYVSAKKMIVVK